MTNDLTSILHKLCSSGNFVTVSEVIALVHTSGCHLIFQMYLAIKACYISEILKFTYSAVTFYVRDTYVKTSHISRQVYS
jgi:hypothetical protein